MDYILSHCNGHNTYSQKQNLRQKTFLASGNTWYNTSAWNIANILRVPMISTIAGDLSAICCVCIAAIFQSCILCGLIPTNSRYFELFQSNSSLDAEITDNTFHRYYYSGNFPKLTEELRECVIANSSIQENGVLIKHIPVKGGHLFWTVDISVLLDPYQDIEEQQE